MFTLVKYGLYRELGYVWDGERQRSQTAYNPNPSGMLSKLAVLEAAIECEPLATEHAPVGGSTVSVRPHVNDANHRAVKYRKRMHATVPVIMMRRTGPGTRASVWQPLL